MKHFTTLITFVIFTIFCYSQTPNLIKYPFSIEDKSFTTINHHLNFNYKKYTTVSFDGKYGIWFIEKNQIHFYNLLKGKWELFDENNGRFKDGQVGIIYHDSKGNTWLGCVLPDAFLDGYGAIRGYSGGVSYYDGNELKLYQNNDINMASPEIYSISEGPDGEIFISTGSPTVKSYEAFYPGGLFMYKDNQWYNYTKGDGKCPVKYISEFIYRNDTTWFVTTFTAQKNSICYFDGKQFTVPKRKQPKNWIFASAFTSNDVWIAAVIGNRAGAHYQRYNWKTNEFQDIGKSPYHYAPYRTSVLGDDLVCFYLGHISLWWPASGYSKKRKKRALEELTIELIDNGKIISSVEQKITKSLYFSPSAAFIENVALFATNEGILSYSNGEFYRNAKFESLSNKKVSRILDNQNKKALIVCEDTEAFIYDGNLTKLVFFEENLIFNYFLRDINGDIFLSTGESVYWVKTSSINNEVKKIAGDLNNCVAIYKMDNIIYLICDDGIVSVNI